MKWLGASTCVAVCTENSFSSEPFQESPSSIEFAICLKSPKPSALLNWTVLLSRPVLMSMICRHHGPVAVTLHVRNRQTSLAEEHTLGPDLVHGTAAGALHDPHRTPSSTPPITVMLERAISEAKKGSRMQGNLLASILWRLPSAWAPNAKRPSIALSKPTVMITAYKQLAVGGVAGR